MKSQAFLLLTSTLASLFTHQSRIGEEVVIEAFPETSIEAPVSLLDVGEKTTTTATGSKVDWTVYSLPAFPRHSMRLKRGGNLCDPGVEQVF